MQHLDGNAVAGLLNEIFGRDITADVGTCAGCGAREPVGAIHAYRSAGITLRCPHCGAVVLRVVTGESRVWLDSSGLRTLELRVPPG